LENQNVGRSISANLEKKRKRPQWPLFRKRKESLDERLKEETASEKKKSLGTSNRGEKQLSRNALIRGKSGGKEGNARARRSDLRSCLGEKEDRPEKTNRPAHG